MSLAFQYDTRSMSVDEARACVNRINGHLEGARRDLMDLYERRGWEPLGYGSWRECVVAEFGHSQAHLYRQLQAARIEQVISPIGEIGAIPEGQLRPLAALPPEQQAELYRQAVETAPNGKVTAAHVESVVEEFREGAGPGPQRRSFLSVGFSSESPEWYTPTAIIERAAAALGAIDLDPCSNSHEAPNVPAARHFTAAEDGLSREWAGRVYLNPPYGREIDFWVTKLVAEFAAGRVTAAVALVPARTDTEWFRRLRDFPRCFVSGRLRFSGQSNSAPFPSCAVYLGADLAAFLAAFADLGDIFSRLEASPDAS